jgi:multiple sugar transport system substrate-binding protein
MYFPMTRRRLLTQTGKAALAAGISGAALAACGGDSQPSGPVTITFGWWSNTPAKDQAMKDWIKTFESSHPDIKVKPEILQWTNYWDKLKTTTAGGNAYDVIGMSSGVEGPYFDSGALLDLSQQSDYQDSVKNLSAGALKVTQWDGQTLALPIGTSISVLGYNKKLLKDAGINNPDPANPMTFEEFIAMGKQISKKGGPYAINPIDILTFDTFTRLEGGQVYDNPINPTRILINSPEGIQGLKDYKRMFDEGIAPPYAELTNGPWSYDYGALETHKIAFARVGPWLFSDMSKNPDYAITPLFKIKQAVSIGGVNSLAIYAKSKYQSQAWEFIKWAIGTEPQVAFGKFSDIPADKAAFDQMATYTNPPAWAATMKAAFAYYVPDLVTTKDMLTTTFNDLITEMMSGKITPEDTAAKMEEEGNQVLSAS